MLRKVTKASQVRERGPYPARLSDLGARRAAHSIQVSPDVTSTADSSLTTDPVVIMQYVPRQYSRQRPKR
jgi:hypothetical protein